MPSTVTFHPLLRHADLPAPPGLAIAAGAGFAADGSLHCHYRLAGELAALALPAPQAPAAVDGLWQHSCCEAFVAAVDAAGYREFNFSPSGCWAAYAFAAYRERDAAWSAAAAPVVSVRHDGNSLQLTATIPAALLPAGPALRVGLTAVVETVAGAKSYWALHHAGPAPDFHLPASFTLVLNRP